MDNYKENIPQIYDSAKEYNDDMYEVYSTRYDNRNDNRFDNRFDNRYYNDRMYDRMYDRRYDNDYDRRRYYQYPYCDRYGRCDNSLWWMFWPLFFL